jgi:hypothetical protein
MFTRTEGGTMKIQHNVMALASVVVLLTAAASGQITITGGDVGAHLQAGNTITQNKDTLLTSLDIGAPGSTSWDFSPLGAHSSTQLTGVAPGGTPFASQFPGATHVLKSTIVGPYPGVPGTVNADVYIYYAVGSRLDRLSTMATGIVNTGPPINLTLPAELHDTYWPVDTTYVLPMTIGTTWTSTYVDTMAITVLSSPYSTTVTNRTFSYTVDAYGPMTMPGGATYDALRVRRVESGAASYLVYIFIARNGASVTVTAADLGQPTNGVIQIARSSLTWNRPATPLPVQLSYFRVARQEGGASVALSWATLSETNNLGFEVERRNGTAGAFDKLPGVFIPGHGTTITPNTYGYVDAGVLPGTWYYRLRQIDLDGSVSYSEPQSVVVVTGISMREIPVTANLLENYPNPFNGISRISFEIIMAGHVDITVTDLLGREVARLVDGYRNAGRYEALWDAGRFPTGVYVLRLLVTPQDQGTVAVVLTRKMLLSK